jgi:hypothetical protein
MAQLYSPELPRDLAALAVGILLRELFEHNVSYACVIWEPGGEPELRSGGL